MIDSDAWHYVRPLREPSLSLMVTGKPWGRPSPGKGLVFRPLAREVREDLLAQFRTRYLPQ